MPRVTTGSRSYSAPRTIARMLVLAFMLVIAPTRAHAYIDPGSGALIWQAMLAAVFGALVYVRKFVQTLRGRRAIKETRNPEERPSESSSPDASGAKSAKSG